MLIKLELIWKIIIVAVSAVTLQQTSFGQSNGIAYSREEKSEEVATEVRPFRAVISQPDSANMRFIVSISNPNSEQVVIKISSLESGLLYTQALTDKQFYRSYNLAALNDGLYMIDIRKGKEIIKKKVLITTEMQEHRKAVIN